MSVSDKLLLSLGRQKIRYCEVVDLKLRFFFLLYLTVYGSYK